MYSSCLHIHYLHPHRLGMGRKAQQSIDRSIKNARFHYKSNIESLNFEVSRNLDSTLIRRLADCKFVTKNQNVLITGSTGVGKSFLDTALGYQACIEKFKVSYFNTS